jgi:hypothetical protein
MIRANGRDVIKNLDLETQHRLNQLRWGTRPMYDMGDWSGFGVKSDISMVLYAWIDFAMWRALQPVDTLLDAAGLATLELIVTFGNPDDVMNDAWDAAVTVDEATLYVASCEAVGVPPKTMFLQNKESRIQSQVLATSTQHQINLPTGNLYRSFVLKTHSDGVQVDTILNNIILKSGTEVFKHRIAGFLQGDNRLECGIEVPEQDGSAAAIDHYYQEYGLEGYYLLEFCKDGYLTESLDTSRLSSLELVLDVNSVGTADFVEVYPVELIAPPKAVQ